MVVAEDIQGKWMIEEATRNNRKTSLLKNGYFELTQDEFKTNILKDETAYKYSYNANEIKVLDAKSSVYNVRSLTSDTLIIWTEVGNFDFKFLTIKAQPNGQ